MLLCLLKNSSKVLKERKLFATCQAISNELLNHKLIKENVELITKKFQFPKNVLHNYYDLISVEFKSQTYRLTPKYRQVKRDKWICTYNIIWPGKLKIESEGQTKQEASKKAATQVLAWLNSIKRLDNDGSPIVYNQDESKQFRNKFEIRLNLSEHSKNQFQNVFSLYESVKDDLENELVELKSVKANDEFPTVVSYDDWIVPDDNENVNDKLSMDELLKLYSAKEKVQLPISKFKREFEDLIETNRVVIIKGETGCGKSTRIPQYLLEHWVKTRGSERCLIAVTQPRRIAAISLAERVSEERDEDVGNIVGYHVRLNLNFNNRLGRIIYCTTGILLRKLQADPQLKNYTYVILDEAHERDVDTDLLMALLMQSLKLNPSLKLVVMSATIDVKQFQDYYNNAPVLNIPGFSYPVKAHFLNDIKTLNLNETRNLCKENVPAVVIDDVASVIEWIHTSKPNGAILCFLPGWEEINRIKAFLERELKLRHCLILCLHSRLSDKDQRKIFEKPPPLMRKIILATNIAETSVTINDIVYVIDTGIQKSKYFDVEKNILCMDSHWITKSNMIQRKGRAGRVMPGESYHLYTEELSNQFEEHPLPNILKVSLTKIILEAKFYSKNLNAVEFFKQLLCSPELDAIKNAVEELKDLQLLDENENLTSLGKAIALFPLSPQLSKAMVFGVIFSNIMPILNISTFFNEDSEIFTIGLMDKQCVRENKLKFSKFSDHLALSTLYDQWDELYSSKDYSEAQDFCYDNYLNQKRLLTIRKLKQVHLNHVKGALKPILKLDNKFGDNYELMNGILLSSTGYLLRKNNWQILKSRLKSACNYFNRNGHRAILTSESVNKKNEKSEWPFMVYISEMKSMSQRCILVRESGMISPLTVLLFDPKGVNLKLSENEHDLKLYLNDSNISISGSKHDFDDVIKFREILDNFVQYFVYQMTEKGDTNARFINTWEDILIILDNILKKESLIKT